MNSPTHFRYGLVTFTAEQVLDNWVRTIGECYKNSEPRDGLVLEFGVADGFTARILTELMPGQTIYGFDSFKGMPEPWNGFEVGAFKTEKRVDLPGYVIVEGWFEDTLPVFLAEHPEPVRFIHCDADLYSSTKTILTHLNPRIGAGTAIVFDEMFGYPDWREHEYKAFNEFIEARGDLDIRIIGVAGAKCGMVLCPAGTVAY